MSKGKISVLLLRLAIGWLFFYAGITKILSADWTAAGYLKGAKTFVGMYQWFALPANIGWINFLNEWGLTLIGAALILGVMTRLVSYAGILLMLLYYFPILVFPYAGDHSYIIDDHIIYALVLLFLAVIGAGKYWGLDKYLEKIPIFQKKIFKLLLS